MLSRRDAIKGVIAIGGGLAASNIVGQDFEPSLKPAPLHAKKHWPEVNKLPDKRHRELIECKRYVRRWKRWRKSEGEPDQITPSGVAVPFATQPLNFYLRPADEAEQQLKPPQMAVKKNGYLLEAFSYVVTAGYIEPASREGVTCSL